MAKKKKRTRSQSRRPPIESNTTAFKGIEINKPVSNLLGYTVFIYGYPKIGKTTVGVSWPNSIVLACETKGIKAIKTSKIDCRCWDHVLEAVKLLKKSETKKKYSTIVIDTTDLLYKYCLSHCCDKYGFDHPSDQGWAKGWERLSDEFLSIILILYDLGYTLVFISHAKTTQIKADWEEYTRIDPSLANPGRKVLLPYVDVIFYMSAKLSKKGSSARILTTKATREYEAGDRTRCLTDIDIRIPSCKKDQAYKIINGIFKKKAASKTKDEIPY